MLLACQVPSVSNITSLQEFLMDTGKLKTFTHLSVFTPRKRSSWAIYLVVQFAVESVFFGFQVIRTSSTQPTRRSPLILMLCSSQRSYLWGRLMRIIKLHNIKRNHSYLILNMFTTCELVFRNFCSCFFNSPGEAEDELPRLCGHSPGGMQALVRQTCKGWNQ